MNNRRDQHAFTLLELLVVIIIVGVLASVAGPLYTQIIEVSRATEAVNTIGLLRRSMEACSLMNNGTYNGCTLDTMDIEDPSNTPGTHFQYFTTVTNGISYLIQAHRNTLDSGSNTWTIAYCYGCDPNVAPNGAVGYTFPVSGIHWAASPIYQRAIPR
jgi:prepilin-type N-terminal cleavage/methylation domain-containing protein